MEFLDKPGGKLGKHEKVDSREVGLEIGLLMSRFFQNCDDLHYGYWHNGLEVQFSNMGQAQANHSELIISNIPDGTRSILDVGAGAGSLAQKLLDNGYEVDCVSPSTFLSDKLEEKLNDKSIVYRTKYEDLETDKKYDLILFSESFQYIDMKIAFDKSLSIMNENGHLLICDFFMTDAEGKNPLQAGHKFSKYEQIINDFPLEQITEMDITADTAPTIQVLDDFLTKLALPVSELCSKYLHGNYPKLMKILNWKLGKKFDKIENRYFKGQMNVEAYMKYETYRLLLYKS